MPSQQRTSRAVAIPVQTSAPLDSDPVAGDIQALLSNGYGSGALEITLTASANVTATDVRLSLREDGAWAVVAQAGLGDVIFPAIDLVQGRSVKFSIIDAGRPTHAVLSSPEAASLTASAKRLES